MEVESLNWFRFSKYLVKVGTEVLRERLKFSIQTDSFSEYHKLWLEKVSLHSRSDGVKLLWSSLKQHQGTLDSSSQQSLQPLLSKWKRSRGPNDMEIRKQLSVLKNWEDDIQDFMSKHATQHDTLNKWLSELQGLAALNTSLFMLINTWTEEFVNLCHMDQLDLMHITERHHERIENLSADFLNKLKFCIQQGPGELYTILKQFQQNEVNSECALKLELHDLFTSWQPKIDKLLDIWVTHISNSPHQQTLRTLVTDVKHCLSRVHQKCKTGLLDICCKWHINLRKKLSEWDNQFQQFNASTTDLKVLAKSWNDDLHAFPTTRDQQTREFFDSKSSDLQNLKTKRIITDPQWSLLYPANGCIVLKNFDITLLSTLHRNVFPVCPPEFGWDAQILETDHSMGADLVRLKKIRNDHIGHISDPTLSKSEFEKLWMMLETTLNRLSKVHGHKFQENIKEKAAELKTCAFDISEEIKLQLELINLYQADILEFERSSNENLEKCIDLILTLDGRVQKLHQQQAINIPEMQDFKTRMDHMMKGVKRKMANHATNVSRTMRNMETRRNRFEKSVIEGMKKLETRMTCIETILSNPNVNRTKLDKRIYMTRGRTERHKSDNRDVHVRTRAFDHARRNLFEYKHLVVHGKPGEGKTYLALSLVSDLMQTNKEIQPVQIYNANEWEEMVDTRQPLVVFLDDVLGKYGVSESELDLWKKISELIQPNLSCSSIFLIICIRSQIVSAIKLSLSRNNAFSWLFNSNVVDISNAKYCLTKEEREQMLMKYAPNYMDKTDKFTIENILEMESLIGFPQNCKIFRSRQNEAIDVKHVFESNVFLAEEILDISRKNPEIYSFLVLLMISGGSLHFKTEMEEMNNKIKIISDYCNLNKTLNISQIRDIGQSLCGTLVEYSKEERKFSFQHDCIETAVFISFGKNYPDVTLRHCSFKQLSKMCCVANKFRCFDDEDFPNFKIMIDDDHFEVLLERFNKGLESGETESFKYISESLLWKNLRFVGSFSNKMTSANDLLNFLSKRDAYGHSLLIHFIYAKNTQVVERIIRNIAHCDIQDEELVARQLLLAAANACLAEEKDLLNTIIKFRNKVDDFAMLAAASTGNVSVIKMLVLRGGNINATMNIKQTKDILNGIKNCISCPEDSSSSDNVTIFHIACSSGRTDMVTYLMTSYPNLIHRVSNLGYTPIHFAALSENVEVMKVLTAQIEQRDRAVHGRLQAAFDITAKINNGCSVLDVAVQNNNLTIVKYLIETHHILISETDINGWTAIHSAAAGGSAPVIETLIQAGLKITDRTNEDLHALHIAARIDNITVVKYLIETHPMLIAETDMNGLTAIHRAAAGGSVPVIETLIQAGLKITDKTNEDVHALHIAARNDNLRIVKYLIETHPMLIPETDMNGLTALHHAAAGGSVPVIETLIQAGLKITDRANKDLHVLHIAALLDKLTIVKYVIETHSTLIPETDMDGWTAIHYAAGTGSVLLIETLIQAGLKISARTKDNLNVLHIAARNDNLTVVKYLIGTHPMLIPETDMKGWTAIDYAADCGSAPVIETLMQAGLKITEMLYRREFLCQMLSIKKE